MRPTENVVFLRKLKSACPAQAMDQYTPDVWEGALEKFDLAECEAALKVLTGRQPFIAPAEIAAEIRAVWRQRLTDTPVPPPPPGIRDNPHTYLAYMRAAKREIRSGRPAVAALAAGEQAAGALVSSGRLALERGCE